MAHGWEYGGGSNSLSLLVGFFDFRVIMRNFLWRCDFIAVYVSISELTSHQPLYTHAGCTIIFRRGSSRGEDDVESWGQTCWYRIGRGNYPHNCIAVLLLLCGAHVMWIVSGCILFLVTGLMMPYYYSVYLYFSLLLEGKEETCRMPCAKALVNTFIVR